MGQMVITNCIICGSEENECILISTDLMLGIPGQFRLVRCSQCGLVFQNPRPSPSAIGKYYADEYAPHRGIRGDRLLRFRLWLRSIEIRYYLEFGVHLYMRGGRPTRLRKFLWPLRFLTRMLLPGIAKKRDNGALLDVGCGNGFFLNHLRKTAWRLHGVEISEAASKVGREEFGLAIFNGSLEEAGFGECFFDVVNLSHFLEHVYDPVATLKEARRIVKDGGLIVVTVQNIDSMNFRIFGSRWCGHDLPRHMYDFNPETFGKLVEKIGGLEVCEVKFMTSPIVVFYSLLYELRHRRLSFLKPLIVVTIPLQFLFCIALAIAHKGDLVTVYLRKGR